MTTNKTSQAVNELKLDAEQNAQRGYPFFSRQKTDEILAIAQKFERMEQALEIIYMIYENERSKKARSIADNALSFDPLSPSQE